MPEHDIVVHEQTLKQLEAYKTAPGHAMLLLGADGIGKTTLAQRLAAHFLTKDNVAKLEGSAHIRQIAPDEKNTLSIEQIRTLQQFLRLKTTGRAKIRRIILIQHADRLTIEAQNAFLKVLEEPPADTLLILTADTLQALLPTIRSRVQVLTVHVPSKEQLMTFFDGKAEATILMQAYFLSGGLPGLMTALLKDDQNHPLMQSVVTAKSILQQQSFERLTLVESLAKQKDTAKSVCSALSRIALAGLEQAAAKQDNKRIAQWHRILKAVDNAQTHLLQNANAKLTLTNLMLEL